MSRHIGIPLPVSHGLVVRRCHWFCWTAGHENIKISPLEARCYFILGANGERTATRGPFHGPKDSFSGIYCPIHSL